MIIPDLEGELVGRKGRVKTEGVVGRTEPPSPGVGGGAVVQAVPFALVSQIGHTGQAERIVEMPDGGVEVGFVRPVPSADDPPPGGKNPFGREKIRDEQGGAADCDPPQGFGKPRVCKGAKALFLLAFRMAEKEFYSLKVDLPVGILAPGFRRSGGKKG